MAIEALEGLTDEQLFSEANADDAPADTVVAEAPEAPAEQPGQARDDAGRFAGKPETRPETPAATDQPARAPVDDNAAMVPSWRVREINDEKRALADRIAAFEVERANWQRQQPPPKPVEAPKIEKPDPLLDPEGYEKYLEQKFEAKRREDRQETDMELSRQSNTEAFDKAHNEAMRLKNAGDPEFVELSQKMKASLQPGKTLLAWHQERSVKAEVGNDPNAYFDKRLEAFLGDPANQAKVLERIRGGVAPAGNGKPAPTSLPPSLTRATNAATAHAADDDDISNDGLWRHANA